MMVTTHLLELPTEILSHIIHYSAQADIKSFSRCSQHCYAAAQPFLWSSLSLTWPTTNSLHPQPCPLPLSKLRFVRQLSITTNGEVMVEDATVDHGAILRRILLHCDGTRLNKLLLDTHIDDEDLKNVSRRVGRLSDVRLRSLTSITNTGWSRLKRLGQLTRLSLENCTVDDIVMSIISKIPLLRHLAIISCCVSSKLSVQSLALAKYLRSFSISVCDFTGSGLTSLAALSTLDRIDLSFTRVNDEALSWCGCIQSLRDVNISHCDDVTDKGLRQLVDLKLLKELDVSSCKNIDGNSLGVLGEMKSLQKLVISGDQKIDVDKVVKMGLREFKIHSNAYSERFLSQLCQKAGLIDVGQGVVSMNGATRILVMKKSQGSS